MTIFRVVVVAAGIFGAVSVADIPSSTVHAAERDISARDTATPAPADQISPAQRKTLGAVVPKKRKRKKGQARGNELRNAPPEAIETDPGQSFSSVEIIALLRTSRDLSGQNLSGINLSGINLVGVNLSKCNLRGVDLSSANLERADLGVSDLERANLAGANLKMVSLRLSGMIGANLENAILDGAIWQDCRICA